MSTKGYFITGTDTGVGKTLAAVGLMRALQNKGATVAGMKPVACGGIQTASGFQNEDAVALQQTSSIPLSYSEVNPILFEPPIAPHIAAEEAGQPIKISTLVAAYKRLSDKADQIVVEGAGGWLVPLDQQHTMGDLAKGLALPVVLVVGLRLGCLNHALLTVASIRSQDLPLAGWVANAIDPDFSHSDSNLSTLQANIPAPLLASIPWFDHTAPGPDEIAGYYNLD